MIPRTDSDAERVRVLTVEDHPEFRQYISSALACDQRLQIISEAHDGLEAVKQAEDLQPDLVLLDISLPRLNGIDAARRIRSVAPKAKIVFLTQENSSDVVREAFGLGAHAYVLKADAERDLLPAVDAVIQGGKFLSGQVSLDLKDL